VSDCSEAFFLASLHIQFVRRVEVPTEFTGCRIELDLFACPALRDRRQEALLQLIEGAMGQAAEEEVEELVLEAVE